MPLLFVSGDFYTRRKGYKPLNTFSLISGLPPNSINPNNRSSRKFTSKESNFYLWVESFLEQ